MTFAYTGSGKFNPGTWYQAMKKGHTFVTNGPMLLLTVGGAMPGGELKVGKNAKVHIRAQTWAPEAVAAPKALEIVSHGRVIRSAEAKNARPGKLVLEFDLPAGESQWIAARSNCFNGAVARTSPVYVIVNGATFADRTQLKQLTEKRLKILDFIETQRLNNEKYTKGWGPGVVEQLKLRIQDARAKYLALGQTQ